MRSRICKSDGARGNVIPLITWAGVFLLSLILFSVFRRPYIWEWDGFGYVSSTVLHQRHALVTGRWGTILFMIPFWEFHHFLRGLRPEDAWIATSQACMVASAFSVAFTFLLARRLFDRTIGWMCVPFLAGSFGWMSYVSANTSEMVMIAFGLGGGYFLTRGIEGARAYAKSPVLSKEGLGEVILGNNSRISGPPLTPPWKGGGPEKNLFQMHRPAMALALGSFLIGYCILAREQGLAYTPFALLLLVYNWKSLRRRYGMRLIIFPSIAIVVAISGPLYSYITEGQGYLQGFHNPGTEAKTGWDAFMERWSFLLDIWPYLFGLIPLVLSTVGVVALGIGACLNSGASTSRFHLDPSLLKGGLRTRLMLLLSLILPAALHLFVGFLGVRYYLFVLPPLAILAAIGLRYLVGLLWRKRYSDAISIALAVGIVFVVFWFHAKPEIAKINSDLKQRKEFGENLLLNLPEEGLFVLGHNDVMIDFFRQVQVRPGWAPLHFDWEPPKDRAGDIARKLEEGHKVFIHHYGLTGTAKDRQDLKKIEKRFVLVSAPGSPLFEIRQRPSALNYEHKRQD